VKGRTQAKAAEVPRRVKAKASRAQRQVAAQAGQVRGQLAGQTAAARHKAASAQRGWQGSAAKAGSRLGLYRLRSANPPTVKSPPILASYNGATELECGLGILLCRTDHHPASPGDVTPPRPIRPLGRSSADGIRYVIDWAAAPCTRSSGSRRNS
jgi:hypothetical protein